LGLFPTEDEAGLAMHKFLVKQGYTGDEAMQVITRPKRSRAPNSLVMKQPVVAQAELEEYSRLTSVRSLPSAPSRGVRRKEADAAPLQDVGKREEGSQGASSSSQPGFAAAEVDTAQAQAPRSDLPAGIVPKADATDTWLPAGWTSCMKTTRGGKQRHCWVGPAPEARIFWERRKVEAFLRGGDAPPKTEGCKQTGSKVAEASEVVSAGGGEDEPIGAKAQSMTPIQEAAVLSLDRFAHVEDAQESTKASKPTDVRPCDVESESREEQAEGKQHEAEVEQEEAEEEQEEAEEEQEAEQEAEQEHQRQSDMGRAEEAVSQEVAGAASSAEATGEALPTPSGDNFLDRLDSLAALGFKRRPSQASL